MDGRDSRVYVILGDGECEEGSIWEAAMSGVRYGLDNLVVILDNNRIQKMGYVRDTMGIDSWGCRWGAFGWRVMCCDGHGVAALEEALGRPAEEGKPTLVIAETVKGKGVSIMENNPDWHFKMPNKRELRVVREELGITVEELEGCRKPIYRH